MKTWFHLPNVSAKNVIIITLISIVTCPKTSISQNISLSTLRSKLCASSGSFNVLDANLTVFDSLFSNTIDGSDASKFSNTGENLALYKANQYLVVEARQPLAVKDTVFLRMWNMQQTIYRLEFESENMSRPGLTAMLQDKFLNTSTPLNLASTSVINFTVTSDAASKAIDRFMIVFLRPQAGVLPVNFLGISAKKTNEGILVNWKVAAERGIFKYELEKSVDGHSFNTISTVNALGTNGELLYSVIDNNLANAINFYRVKSFDMSGEIKTSAVVKVNNTNTGSLIKAIPNIIAGTVINLQCTNLAKGKYAVRLIQSNGQTIATQSILVQGENTLQVIKLHQKPVAGTYYLETLSDNNEKTVQTIVVR